MSRRRRVGRPPGLTPEVAKKIETAVRAGSYLEAAAEAAGVGRSTLFRWLATADAADAALNGQEDDHAPNTTNDPSAAPYLEFRDSLRRARAENEVRTVALVGKAIQGGYVTKRTTKKYRDQVTGQVVEEIVEDVAPIDGKLGLEFLARSRPEQWGKARSEVTVSGPDGGPVHTEVHVVATLADRVQQLAIERADEDAMPPEDVAEAEIVD